MKVLHISEAMGGGIQTALASYISATLEYDHVLFARSRDGVSTLELPAATRVVTYKGGMVGFLLEAVAETRRMRPDVVHLHSSYAGVLRLLLLPGNNIVYSPHCYATERTLEPRIKTAFFRTFEKIATTRPQTIFAVSDREKQIAKELNKSVRTEVVPNVSLFAKSEDADARCSATSVAMSGRLTRQKDPTFFKNVAKKLEGTGLTFTWIGDGDTRLKDELQSAGVTVTGWITPKEVESVLSGARLYLHTAAWEGAPLATLEAANLGCPVLSRTIPSMQALGYPTAGVGENEVAQNVERFFADASYAEEVRRLTQVAVSGASIENLRTKLIHGYSAAKGNGASRIATPQK